MDEISYLNQGIRKAVIDEVKSNENIEAKKLSYNQFLIYKDVIMPFVEDYLRKFYSPKTIKEMPIMAAINLCRRIINQEASIYIDAPERVFTNVSDDQAQVLRQIYADMKIDTIMLKANQYYRLQGEQIHVYITPSKGKLKARVLLRHQIDAVPRPSDPEEADAYLISGFDRFYATSSSTQQRDLPDGSRPYADNINQKIGDPDDYKSSTERFVWWSDELNFITDKNGNIISEEIENPIGTKPVVDICSTKDSEYWQKSGSSVTDYTIQYNAQITDLAHIMRMQGFAQAVISGPSEMLPESLQIGTNSILRLPVDPNNPVPTSFQFVSPNPDLAGSNQTVENILSAFLTSRGLDPRLVNQKGESKQYSSGLERLLSMIDQFKPSKRDYDVFMDAEAKIYDIIKAYVNNMVPSDVLDYRLAQIPEDSNVVVKFKEPQMVVSEVERLNELQQMRELGVISDLEIIAKARKVDIEEAEVIRQTILQEQSPVDDDRD